MTVFVPLSESNIVHKFGHVFNTKKCFFVVVVVVLLVSVLQKRVSVLFGHPLCQCNMCTNLECSLLKCNFYDITTGSLSLRLYIFGTNDLPIRFFYFFFFRQSNFNVSNFTRSIHSSLEGMCLLC